MLWYMTLLLLGFCERVAEMQAAIIAYPDKLVDHPVARNGPGEAAFTPVSCPYSLLGKMFSKPNVNMNEAPLYTCTHPKGCGCLLDA